MMLAHIQLKVRYSTGMFFIERERRGAQGVTDAVDHLINVASDS